MADQIDPTATDQNLSPAPEPKADPSPSPEPGSNLKQFANEDGQQKSNLADFKPEDKQNEPPPDPIKYEDFTLPEESGVSEALIEEFKELAGSDRLAQDKAQKYLDLGLKIAEAKEKAADKLIADSQKQWEADRKTSPSYKADGAAAYRALSNKAGLSAEEQNFLLETWVGDHPVIRKVLIALDKATSEGTILDGGESGVKDAPLADKMWKH